METNRTAEIPTPARWFRSVGGTGRFGFLDDGRKVVELKAVGTIPAYRFIEEN